MNINLPIPPPTIGQITLVKGSDGYVIYMNLSIRPYSLATICGNGLFCEYIEGWFIVYISEPPYSPPPYSLATISGEGWFIVYISEPPYSPPPYSLATISGEGWFCQGQIFLEPEVLTPKLPSLPT
jgi:hypothetical protein